MDKILYSAFFAVMASFITAALSFVKLVNDKESRITDYRQEWTNSVRKTLADVIGSIRSLTALLAVQAGVIKILSDLTEQKAKSAGNASQISIIDDQIGHQKGQLENIKNEITNTHKELNQTYNFARLHFKIDDPLFSIIEGKFDAVQNLIKELSKNDLQKDEINSIKGKIEVLCGEMITTSRGIMKGEWERIKVGEMTYRKTKSYAKWGGVVLLFILLILGIHAWIAPNDMTMKSANGMQESSATSKEISSEVPNKDQGTKTVEGKSNQ